MAVGNIGYEEAMSRGELLSVQRYEVHLDLSAQAPHQAARGFGSSTSAWFRCASPGSSTWIDLAGARVHTIALNGRNLPVADVYDGHRIRLDELEANNVLHVEATCAYSDSSQGLHHFTDPVDGESYLYTQFEPADARTVFAVFEQPKLRARWRLSVTAPSAWLVASNSQVEEVQDAGPRRRWTFAPTEPLPSYLLALIAGPYHEVTGVHERAQGDVPMAVYCRASLAGALDAEGVLDLTASGLEFYEKLFGVPYPFTKYATAFVPEFEGDAMEHPGLVTCGEECLIPAAVDRTTPELREHVADTLLHEMSHMWFGDLVTIRWWDDLWLNESFAEWAAHLATSACTPYAQAWATFAGRGKVLTSAEDRFPGGRVWATWADQLPSTHAIAAEPGDLHSLVANFDGVTYSKGGSVVRQLVATLGEATFLGAVGDYFAKHAWGAASSADFIAALETASGRDLSGWVRDWLRTPGMNLLRGVAALDAGGAIAGYEMHQEPPIAPLGVAQVLRPHTLELGFFRADGEQLVRTNTRQVSMDGAMVALPLTGEVHPGLILVNDGDLTFARIRLDEVSLATAKNRLGQLAEPLARAQLWAMFWDMTRDGELAASEFVDIAVRGLGGETHAGTLLETVRRLRVVIGAYAEPAGRRELAERVGGVLLGLLGREQPGSLAVIQGFAMLAHGDEQLDWLAGLLDGRIRPPGVVVGADLRWRAILRLAATGRIGQVAIDAELSRDSSAQGHRAAASARAALPETEAKQWAWQQLIEARTLSQSQVLALTVGLAQGEDPRIYGGLAERLVEDLPGVWRRRSYKVAHLITVGLLGALPPDAAVIGAAESLLGAEVLPSQARRHVLEGLDDVVRAVRGQGVDAAWRLRGASTTSGPGPLRQRPARRR